MRSNGHGDCAWRTYMIEDAFAHGRLGSSKSKIDLYADIWITDRTTIASKASPRRWCLPDARRSIVAAWHSLHVLVGFWFSSFLLVDVLIAGHLFGLLSCRKRGLATKIDCPCQSAFALLLLSSNHQCHQNADGLQHWETQNSNS